MQKQKIYAAINIGGFATGIAACLLIFLYIRHETNYDRDNPKRHQIYRIVGEAINNGRIQRDVSFPPPMCKALVNDFPEIEKGGRIMSNRLFGGASNQMRRVDQENNTYEEGFCFADTSMLDILNIRMIYGNQKDALAEPNSVVLCKSMADKYFPNENPVGKMMIFNDNSKMPIRVGGVMQDFPENAHLQYRGFISLSGINFWDGEQQGWTSSNYGIYLQLRPDVDIQAFNKKMTADVLNKYLIPSLKASGMTHVEKLFNGARLYLQPISDIHLYSYDISEGNVKHGDIRFIWLFAAIAIFILALACINFINLSTARSANRAVEVGVRKAIGSNRMDLIRQFLVESLVYSFLSFTIAMIITALILPLFSDISGASLHMPWNVWWLFPFLFCFAIIVGILAGLYPAFYLSYFKPVNVLKGNLRSGSKHAGIRSGLVVFQFTISIILVIGTAVIHKQMRFILNSDTGFDKDQIVMIQGADALREQSGAFRNELMQLPFVKNASVSDFIPVAAGKRNGNTFWKDGKSKIEDGISGQHWVIDENYLPTFGIRLVAGRNFSKDMPTDAHASIINKAMADHLAYKNPLGQMIENGGEHTTIIGVVDDFYYQSMKQHIDPLVMVLGNSSSVISVKINGSDMKDALASIMGVWKRFVPHQTMRYDFLDQSYAAMYADVQRMGSLFTGFSVLAIIIACLGLFALSAFMTEQRGKEISIRKVLGASVASLFALLTRNFLKQVFIALVIAIPLGWMLMQWWLEDYVYRVRISWQIFLFSGVGVLVIALVTICWQTGKTATTNPVKRLRNE